TAKKLCREIGYPVMVKATAGGGGRGIRMVENEADLEAKFDEAQSEAKICFGNGDLYIEKFVVNPRHIEVQLLADNYGNVVHLGERDCSLQRRNQKVLEESPSPIMTEELRAKMGAAAVAAAKACGYRNAGTIEFLVDKDKNFYFMEMNTRIQVEHPVTEFVTGIDLVKAQIRIAGGEKLWFSQDDVKVTGHAIECRINAEDPRKNFCPCPGTINSIHVPGGFNVRIDSAAYTGYEIPPQYDSMIAKLIVKGEDREEAINKMRVALSEFIIDGVETNIDFHLRLLKNKNFEQGKFDNGFLNRTDIMNG
ncbi:MAG: ATP-grasp domain-containing protein, partial [Oscillospiraceae bacterium]|nr:ATP-grasp domain-containing protein [Oscillospiraceae bacterium]